MLRSSQGYNDSPHRHGRHSNNDPIRSFHHYTPNGSKATTTHTTAQSAESAATATKTTAAFIVVVCCCLASHRQYHHHHHKKKKKENTARSSLVGDQRLLVVDLGRDINHKSPQQQGHWHWRGLCSSFQFLSGSTIAVLIQNFGWRRRRSRRRTKCRGRSACGRRG